MNEKPSSYEELRALAAFWQLETTQIEAGRYSGHLLAVHTAKSQLALARHGCGTRVGGSVPNGTMVLSLSLNTGGPIRFRGRLLDDRELCVHDARHGLDFGFHSRLDVLSLAVSRAFFERRACALWHCEPEEISSGLLRLEGSSQSLGLRRFLVKSLREASSKTRLLVSEMGEALEERLVDGILAATREPLPLENTLARRWLARRAADLLEERFRENIGIFELCTILHASRRTLHLGFLEVFGIPPIQYLRVLRLNAARREILSPASAGVPLTHIAMNCGFSHLGRFSCDYKSFFGVLPSEERPRKRA